MHPNEPTLEALKDLQKQLFVEESTDDNMRKLRAIESQITRREQELAAQAKK
jgi:hypothetical protein